LSHAVEDRNFKSRDKLVRMKFRALVRPYGRQWGKAFISPEIANVLNAENKAKLTSKYMTLCMASIGSPLMMMFCLNMLIKLRSTLGTSLLSYSWAGVKAETHHSIKLNRCMKLQLGFEPLIDFDYVQIKTDEIVHFKEFASDFVLDYNDIIDKDKRIKVNKIKEIDTDDYYYWDYNDTLDKVIKLMTELDRISLVASPQETIKWWDTTDIGKEQTITSTVLTKNKNSCTHIREDTIEQVIGIDKETPYMIIVKCPVCYRERKEKRYEGINICIEDYTASTNYTEED
jgi:hypothetical protein